MYLSFNYMQFYSCVFISGSQEAGIEWHKMEQSLSRFVTPVEKMKPTIRMHAVSVGRVK